MGSGRDSPLVAEGAGSSRHPVGWLRSCSRLMQPPPAPAARLFSQTHSGLLPSPPALNHSLDPPTSSPRSSGSARAGGNCDYCDKGMAAKLGALPEQIILDRGN